TDDDAETIELRDEATVLAGQRAGLILTPSEAAAKGAELSGGDSRVRGDAAAEGDDGYRLGAALDDLYESLEATVPTTDDPSTPALTFRVWVLGTGFALILAAVNTLFTFRSNTFAVNPFIGVLLSYPLGHLMAVGLPTRRFAPFGERLSFSFNPGPFSLKEHALIYVYASTASGPAYALYNIIGQRYQLYQTDLSVAACLAFGIVTQCFGYGLAGLCRRFLVRPTAMLWPANLSTIALLNSLHRPDDGDDGRGRPSRFAFFWAAASAMAVYQVFPSYIAPLLSAISILCYVAPVTSNPQLTRMLGSAQPGGGLGMLSVTLDWSIVSAHAPITTPLWALLNQFLGIWFMMWVVVPVLWRAEVFGHDTAMGSDPRDGPNGTRRFPLGQALNTPQLFLPNGTRVAARDFVNMTTLRLDEAFYAANGPAHISTYFAMEYFTSFAVFAATAVHVGLWYGPGIWRRLRARDDADRGDVHARLMEAYADVPDAWYLGLLAVTLVAGICVCQWGGFDLPFWGVLLALLLAGVSMVPIGTIQAVSGQQIGLNVMSEFLIGLVLPGRVAAVMSFKTLSYMAMHQGLFLVQDLKLAQYVKIPPRAMFSVQLAATLLAVIVNVFTAFGVYEAFGRSSTELVDPARPDLGYVWTLQSADPPKGWNVFLNAGAIWGAIGPARFFGPSSPYWGTLFGFLVGATLPVILFGLHRLMPRNKYLPLINVPLILVFPMQAGGFRSDLLTPVAVGVMINFVIRRRWPEWWRRYAYVLSAALDSGSAAGLALTFLVSAANPSWLVPFPSYILNRADVELCAPDFYQTCVEHMLQGNGFGHTYNISDDAYCSSIHFGAEADL
ncbi:hypothetical protein HK405_004711, partial [Cladochytrium tenue]